MKYLLSGLLLLAAGLQAQERIVSAGAGVTGLIQALGAADQLVAVDSSSHLPADQALPVVGYHRQLATEGLLALKPSLLLGSEEMGPASTLQQVAQAGVKVVSLPAGGDVPSLQANIQTLGALLQRPEAARQLTQAVDRQVSQLSQQAARLPVRPRLVYLLVVPGRPPMVAGGNTPADTLIRLAGGENPAAGLRNYPLLNLEGLLAMKPDGLVVSERGLQADPQLLQHTLPQLAQTPELKSLPLYTSPGAALIGGLNLTSLSAAADLQQKLLFASGSAS